jgi:recombination protein RecA
MAKLDGGSCDDILAQFHKSYGDKVGGFGYKDVQTERVPTGFFAFDLASGGGLPRGRTTIVYGPESSGKTNLVLACIRNHQQLWPDLVCVIVDIENSFDAEWARSLGVDVDKLLVLKPDYAEQVVDMVESMLMAEDIGLVAIDSLAAMVTTQEVSSSAEKAIVGGASLAVGKLVRKTTLALSEAGKQGRSPTLIYVNQIRFKVGVMFGDPETMPGGMAPKYQAALQVRLYGKNITDNKISTTVPIGKQTKVVIKKWKVPIVGTHCEYIMVTYPHDGLQIGQTADWGLVSGYLKESGLLSKTGSSGWELFDKKYKTLSACEEKFISDPKFAGLVKQVVIDMAFGKSADTGPVGMSV